jgi:DUF4097 and DUF4098 domain-containing protein YvlB
MIALGLSGLANAETKEFYLSEISKVEIKNGSGDVNITAASSGKATVTATKKQFGEHCKLTIDKKGKTLFVEVEKTGVFKDDCEIDFDITAPKTVVLDLDSGSGDLKVNGTSGDLSFNVGSGSVDVDAEVKKLEGKSGSGDVSIRGLTTGGNLKTGSGKINLVYNVAPALGELDIKTGSGRAEIVLPKTAKVRTSFTAGSGELTNEFGDTPESKFRISMKAGSGDLQIKKQ